MSEYRNVYWNEIDQRMWRTTTTIGDVGVRYEYIGMMTEAEYDLLIEVLWELFDDNKISLDEFQRIFGDIRSFCDRLKKIIEET
jgi:chemotaxis regulatin CheY-phosphate phosphatase CheZ